MAIVVGNSGTTNGNGLSFTVPGFAVLDIPYRIMIVGTATRRPASAVSAVTCNGKSFSYLGTVTNATEMEIEVWYLLAPDVGTYDVSITFTGSAPNETAIGACVFYGVHQASPFGTLASQTGSDAAPSVAVTSGSNELVIDVVGGKGTSAGAVTFTVGAGQTQIFQAAYASIPKANSASIAMSYEAGAASVTMSWTIDVATAWAIGGVSLKPAPVALPIQ